MTSLVYPRLPDGPSRILIAELLDASTSGLEAVQAMCGVAHPRASAIATGGRQATETDIHAVRDGVMEAVGGWVQGKILARKDQPLFDASLGRALHTTLNIIPADAGHEATWNFLTLVVFPDVALTRFPKLPDERALGTPRNIMRRAWTRYEILGDTLFEGQPILGEDELVGLLERTAVARNRSLTQELAQAVLGWKQKGARSEFARDLYKRIRHRTGPLMLDIYSPEELYELIQFEISLMKP